MAELLADRQATEPASGLLTPAQAAEVAGVRAKADRNWLSERSLVRHGVRGHPMLASGAGGVAGPCVVTNGARGRATDICTASAQCRWVHHNACEKGTTVTRTTAGRSRGRRAGARSHDANHEDNKRTITKATMGSRITLAIGQSSGIGPVLQRQAPHTAATPNATYGNYIIRRVWTSMRFQTLTDAQLELAREGR